MDTKQLQNIVDVDVTIDDNTSTDSGNKVKKLSIRQKKNLNNMPFASPGTSNSHGIDEDVIMILSRLDEASYHQALAEDSNTFLNKSIFPKSFPWHKPRAPLLRNLARDIDDMPGVLYADDDIICPFGSQAGYFGYGRFESGRYRKESAPAGFGNSGTKLELYDYDANSANSKNRKSRSKASEGLLGGFEKLRTVARRSVDPGVMEVTVMMPPPPSIASALVTCQNRGILPQDPWIQHDEYAVREAKAIIEGERAELSSCMPLYWKKGDKNNFFNPPAFIDEEEQNMNLDDTENSADNNIVEQSQKFAREMRTRADLTKACTRIWNVSVKVAGVSSRSTLINDTKRDKQKTAKIHNSSVRKKVKPLMRIASFPASVQTGKTVSLETAALLDEQGLASSLGTYDCRATSNSTSVSSIDYQNYSKKEKEGRSKRINVGRTRLIWSGMQCNFEDDISTRSKALFSCFLTGRKLDAAGYKRPREALVTVKVNGKVVRETIPETDTILNNTDSNAPMRHELEKKITPGRRPKQEESVINKLKNTNKILTEKEIDYAVDSIVLTPNDGKVVTFSPKRKKTKRANLICSLDTQEFLTSMMKFERRTNKKAGRSSTGKQNLSSHDNHDFSSFGIVDDHSENIVPMKYGGGFILKHTPPFFNCLPVDDGFFKLICKKKGTMQGSSTHHLLNLAAQKESTTGPTCSVCWTGDGPNGSSKVMECLECGLSVHLECCLDQGELFNVSDENGYEHKASTDEYKSDLKWRCPVCIELLKKSDAPTFQSEISKSNRKSNRSSRMPSRFTSGSQRYSLPQKKATKNRPNHKCTLCPHSGGAMSRLDRYNPDSKLAKRWTHEVCRIWCGSPSLSLSKQVEDDVAVQRSQSTTLNNNIIEQYFDIRCVLCGMGEIHNAGRDKEETIELHKKGKSQESKTFKSYNNYRKLGLVKCAAKGCKVMFHPLCALLVSKLHEEVSIDDEYLQLKEKYNLSKENYPSDIESLKKSLERDISLCQHYTLDLLKLTRYEGMHGSLQGNDKTCVVPVAFCGIHNPCREPSLHGCPPAGGVIASHMRVPSNLN